MTSVDFHFFFSTVLVFCYIFGFCHAQLCCKGHLYCTPGTSKNLLIPSKTKQNSTTVSMLMLVLTMNFDGMQSLLFTSRLLSSGLQFSRVKSDENKRFMHMVTLLNIRFLSYGHSVQYGKSM